LEFYKVLPIGKPAGEFNFQRPGNLAAIPEIPGNARVLLLQPKSLQRFLEMQECCFCNPNHFRASWKCNSAAFATQITSELPMIEQRSTSHVPFSCNFLRKSRSVIKYF
jgi:hypothetical protein